MKRYFISFCVIISIVSIMFVGCGGSKSGGGRKQIKIFETSGGVVYNMSTNQSGIVFADNIVEIGNEYILFFPWKEAIIPSIDVALFDENGNRQSDIINLTIDGDQCIDLTKIFDNPNGGKSGQLIGLEPGGKCRLIATCGELSRSVNIWVYDSYELPRGNLRITQNEKTESGISKIDSTVYGVVVNEDGNIYNTVKITKGSYLFKETTQSTWRNDLKSLDKIDVTQTLTDGNELNPRTPKIYVAETPDGGHIKIVAIGSSIIWEYTNTNSFK